VARWIQARAGGRQQVKLVHVGRPWAATELFDLIISTPQYALPLRPNILHNEAPMNRVSSTKLAAAAEQWRHRLEPWGRPWIAVMLGGHVGPYTFTPLAARHLAAQVSAMATSLGGSLLISSSARTPQGALNAFAQALDAPHFLYRWRADDPENPYLGLLALADRIVVTSDSMSMLVEAVATGKPVFIFDLGSSDRRSDGALDWLPTRRELVFHLGRLFGPAQLARDVGAIHRAQVTAGRAVWLGQSWMLAGRTLPLEDTSRAAARVRELFKNQQAV
jgi:mitochondrial fission protein ELM1